MISQAYVLRHPRSTGVNYSTLLLMYQKICGLLLYFVLVLVLFLVLNLELNLELIPCTRYQNICGLLLYFAEDVLGRSAFPFFEYKAAMQMLPNSGTIFLFFLLFCFAVFFCCDGLLLSTRT